MTAFKRVEDIEAWQEARKLIAEIYKLTGCGAWSRDYGLRDQTQKAVVSIACNIAEGFARESNTEFCRFLAIARGSAMEVKTQIYIALDLGYLDQNTFESMYARIETICRMITRLMQYLKKTPKPPWDAKRSPKPTTDN